MKKIILVCAALITGGLQAQETDIMTIYKNLYETNIRSFLSDDTTGYRLQRESPGRYIFLNAFEKQVYLKAWPGTNGSMLVGLILEENDPVMTHQQVRFFHYRNGQTEPAQPVDPVIMANFFPSHYLLANNIDPAERVPDPVFVFYPTLNSIGIRLQNESFDPDLMGGDDPLTRLDPQRMAVTSIRLSPSGNDGFEITERQYRVDADMDLVIPGNWENSCEAPTYFTAKDNRLVFSASFGQTGNEKFSIVTADDAVVRVGTRCLFAYGKSISETEGVVFYDSALVKDPQKQWFVPGSETVLQPGTGGMYVIPNGAGEKKPSFKRTSATEADAALRKAYPALFSLPADAGPGITASGKTCLYVYAVELRVTMTRNGQTTERKLVFRVRHGEC